MHNLKFKTFNFLVVVLPFYFLLFTFFSGCATVPRQELGISTIPLGGTQYLSLTNLSNKMGWNCDYEVISRQVILTAPGKEIKLMPNSRIVLVNNNAYDIRYPVQVYQSQIFVPLKFKQSIADSLYIRKPEIKIQPPLTQTFTYTIRRIVIDSGHGGNDPGAIARSGLREKDVVLDISRRVKKILEASGMDILMTRNADKFISLGKRAEIANRYKADLFVSIHANANPSRKLSGFEVYYLSDQVDDQARALVAAENASLDLDKAALKNSSLTLKTTLWDMIYTQNRAESIDLAKNICQVANEEMELRILGIKGAPFYVLKGTQMPAVLVEVGFLSHAEEEKLLRNAYYRQQLADAISRGILNYSRELQTMEAKR